MLNEQQDLNPLEVTTSDDLPFRTACVILGSLMDLVDNDIL